MTIPDIVEETIWLFTQANSLSQITEGRIFGYRLPQNIVTLMPMKVLVLKSTGGPDEISYLPIQKTRFDFWCYGETEAEAAKIDIALVAFLKNLKRTATPNTLIFNAQISGGVYQAQEAEVGWPILIRSALIVSAIPQIS